MTVSYTGDVANGSSFGCFWKILGRWKGSVYKLIWRELIAYLILYFTINCIYRYGMDSQQRHTFEKVKVYCSKQIESIPMSFVLGFYVSLIVKRWWDQYWLLPLPDSLALFISASLHGQDERGRILRRTIMRYVILSFIITLQRISFRVKKRFPSLQHLVDAGLMMESEKKIFDMFENKTTVSKFWMPTVWASNLVNRARLEGRIQSDHMVQSILNELSDFRRRLGRVMVYDTVSVPLVYTQVVTMAVYTYFVAALIGRQWVHPDDAKRRSGIYPGFEIDLCFPIFLSLQFIFYIGWLKVAETLINPFGEDDDDFELNWLIDRHIQVSYMVVDEMHEEHPELLKDQYWDQVVPAELPYNIASEQFRRKEPEGSTASMKIKTKESVYDNLTSVKRHNSIVPDEVYTDLVYSYGQESVAGSPLVDARKNWLQRQLSRVESFRSTSSSSSLFNRPRHQHNPHINGGIPGLNNGGGHRMSLYEKLMNRRSSKENRNSPRVPPARATGNNANGVPMFGGKENMSTLMPHPQSRPRVPTPEVTKDTQVNLMSSPPIERAPVTALQPNPNGATSSSNGGYTNPSFSGSFSNLNYTVSNVSSTLNNGGLTIVGPPKPPLTPISTIPPPPLSMPGPSKTSAPLSPTIKTPPPAYETADAAHNIMLSPIEENDGSPYSTSSTSRSSRSSYPTTTTIFGRKTTPPPLLLEGLPPIPISPGDAPCSDQLSPKRAMQELEAAFMARSKEDDDEGTEDDPYQTISEVGEAKAEFMRNPHTNLREFHGGRRYSKEKSQLMVQKLQSVISADKWSQASHPGPFPQPPPKPSMKTEIVQSPRGNSTNSSLFQEDRRLQLRTPTHSRQSSYDKSTNTDVELFSDSLNNNVENINSVKPRIDPLLKSSSFKFTPDPRPGKKPRSEDGEEDGGDASDETEVFV